MRGFAQLRMFNGRSCDIPVIVGNQKFTLGKLSMWENISIPLNGEVSLIYRMDMSRCRNDNFSIPNTGKTASK